MSDLQKKNHLNTHLSCVLKTFLTSSLKNIALISSFLQGKPSWNYFYPVDRISVIMKYKLEINTRKVTSGLKYMFYNII